MYNCYLYYFDGRWQVLATLYCECEHSVWSDLWWTENGPDLVFVDKPGFERVLWQAGNELPRLRSGIKTRSVAVRELPGGWVALSLSSPPRRRPPHRRPGCVPRSPCPRPRRVPRRDHRPYVRQARWPRPLLRSPALPAGRCFPRWDSTVSLSSRISCACSSSASVSLSESSSFWSCNFPTAFLSFLISFFVFFATLVRPFYRNRATIVYRAGRSATRNTIRPRKRSELRSPTTG